MSAPSAREWLDELEVLRDQLQWEANGDQVYGKANAKRLSSEEADAIAQQFDEWRVEVVEVLE